MESGELSVSNSSIRAIPKLTSFVTTSAALYIFASSQNEICNLPDILWGCGLLNCPKLCQALHSGQAVGMLQDFSNMSENFVRGDGSGYNPVNKTVVFVDCVGNGHNNSGRKTIYDLYLANSSYINNWDLVDSSASQIVGQYLNDKDRQQLFVLAESNSLWHRRIAIMATFYFIRQNDFTDTLRLATRLLEDKEDLIHKAVGWMLREVGNRDMPAAEGFLKKHYKNMPRTMLRYAIEKFDNDTRVAYLQGRR